MANIKIKLKEISDIVNFHFYYSQYQHIGWPRSSRNVSTVITIYTTNDLIEKNSHHLFEPSFFPQEEASYVSWVKRSLILLGWKIGRGEDRAKKLFDLFEKNGMIAGVLVFSHTKKANIDLSQYEQYVQNGEIDFLVMITQDFKDSNKAQLSKGIVFINHHDLPKLHLMLKSLPAIK